VPYWQSPTFQRCDVEAHLFQLSNSVLNYSGMFGVQFFCFVATVAYAVDVFFQVRDLRQKLAAPQQSGQQVTVAE